MHFYYNTEKGMKWRTILTLKSAPLAIFISSLQPLGNIIKMMISCAPPEIFRGHFSMKMPPHASPAERYYGIYHAACDIYIWAELSTNEISPVTGHHYATPKIITYLPISKAQCSPGWLLR